MKLCSCKLTGYKHYEILKKDTNERQPNWKIAFIEDSLNIRQPQWKATTMEDYLNVRRPQWKITLIRVGYLRGTRELGFHKILELTQNH